MVDKQKWTPGPWIYSGKGSRIGNGPQFRGVFAELGGKFWCVAQMTYYRYTYGKGDEINGEAVEQEADANCRLISKAPELYEALEAALKWIKEMADSGDAGSFEAKHVPEWVAGEAVLKAVRGE